MDICNISDTSTGFQLPPNSKICSVASPKNTNVHAQLYKKNPDISKQQERRQALLKWQREGRNTSVDNNRSILDIIDAEESNELDENSSLGEEMLIEQESSHRKRSFWRKYREYDAQLMLSEWFISIPPNFESEWSMKFCPKGRRTLVVASRGKTKAFDKRGNLTAMFRSELPGGHNGSWKIGSVKCRTVLDCIYNDSNQTFYVLDVLAWNNQETTNCDTVFRFNWLQSKLAEMRELSDRNRDVNEHNKYSFVPLPFIDCTAISLSNALSIWPLYLNDSPNIDGMLFYHKGTTYTPGETPLVLWLKTFMVPEVLGINIAIAEQYINCKPDNYSGQHNYIEEFRKNLNSQKRIFKNLAFGRNSTSASMDTCEPGQNNLNAEFVLENVVNMEENVENVCSMES